MQKPIPFTHLHVHSEFSLLKAACGIDDLVQLTAEFGMEAIALTDSGNLFAAFPFMDAAKRKGLQPIVGMQVAIARGNRADRGRESKRSHEMVLLATSHEGWLNLLQLATIGYLEGFYYIPRIDHEVLARHSSGLIALSGALHGEIGSCLNLDQDEVAETTAATLAEVFGKDNFFLELQDHGLPQETKVNEKSIALARKLGLPVVATNNVRYSRADDEVILDVLLCIGQGQLRSEENRQRFGPRSRLRSPAEMQALFGHWPESLHATEEIRQRTRFELGYSGLHIPEFVPPGQKTPEVYLRDLCETGLARLYSDSSPPAAGAEDTLAPPVRERLEKELGVISRMGFTNYFLIVCDFIKHAKQIGVPVGPGRGSAAGSIVAYGLGITGIDPLRYDLLFERFLNEGRKEMPDIDIDFETEGRARVIEYVTQKYGRENVAQIITFGTMAARGALRDVARVLDIPLDKVDAIAKKVPMGSTLTAALELEPDLRGMIAEDPSVRELFDIARRIEGLSRQAGTHAAGVIIADAPIQNYCPLFKNGDDIATQFDMHIVEKVGLLKIDFLGLSTLTLIQRAESILKESHGLVIDWAKLPLDDIKTYKLLSRGEARGVFQFESDGMRQLLIKMEPDRFEDLVALVALYRPGPLQSGMVDKYVDVKHGRDVPSYLLPALKPILEETYGVILYQEQVMRIASDVAGFTLQEADQLRKGMGKKKQEVIDVLGQQFCEQAGKRGFDVAIAREVFDLMAFFAGYGFNKSHSVAYAAIAYQTAWLKANYPIEFMAALLTVESQNTDKVVAYMEESKRMGIRVLPPNVNRSSAHFTVEVLSPEDVEVPTAPRRGNAAAPKRARAARGRPTVAVKAGEAARAIRFGMGAIKGVGWKAMEGVVEERGAKLFTSLYDFCERVDIRLNNRGSCEALIKAGAFDVISTNRAALVATLDRALAAGSRAQNDRRVGQGDLFGAMIAGPAAAPPLPDTTPWDDRQRLAYEKEAVGFYVSGHPLGEYADLIRDYSTTTASGVATLVDGDSVILGGMITSLAVRIIQKEGRNQGRKMAKFAIEDLDGSVSCVMFPGQYDKFTDLVHPDSIIFARAKVSCRGAEPELMIDDLLSVDRAQIELTRNVVLHLDPEQSTQPALYEELSAVCQQHRGGTPVLLELYGENGGLITIRSDENHLVSASPAFVAEAAGVIGRANVRLLAR